MTEEKTSSGTSEVTHRWGTQGGGPNDIRQMAEGHMGQRAAKHVMTIKSRTGGVLEAKSTRDDGGALRVKGSRAHIDRRIACRWVTNEEVTDGWWCSGEALGVGAEPTSSTSEAGVEVSPMRKIGSHASKEEGFHDASTR
ncbi:hypothetical protein B296_00011866 [Ensete ventricosum]|uniref:Uncharacterized protein n=1 Tax=Ensete ventricosum TaxID=4639 RepID=A0A427B9F9_ENSVE|nr:hypothetical protein B296_00011866 [Ensete ventricosum]